MRVQATTLPYNGKVLETIIRRMTQGRSWLARDYLVMAPVKRAVRPTFTADCTRCVVAQSMWSSRTRPSHLAKPRGNAFTPYDFMTL